MAGALDGAGLAATTMRPVGGVPQAAWRRSHEGSGSTVTFVIGGRKLTVDRPHPRREL
jgi:hypothetical protein